MARKTPVVLSTRTTEEEAAAVRTVAHLQGETVAEWARRALVRAARQSLARELEEKAE